MYARNLLLVVLDWRKILALNFVQSWSISKKNLLGEDTHFLEDSPSTLLWIWIVFFYEVMRGQFINFFYYNRLMNSFRGISLSKRMVRSVDSHCLNFTGTSVHRNFVEVGNPQDDSKWLRSLSHSKTETICKKAFIIESLSVTLSAVECLLLLQL
jgi:hypothetical protein